MDRGPAGYIVEGVAPARVESPADVHGLSSAVRQIHNAGESAIPWGGGTRMHVGGLPRRYDVAIDLTRLNRILEYEPADLTVIVEAGVCMADLHTRLASEGQRLPFDPPLPERATVGGSLASNAVGSLRSGFGGVRDLVIGMKVVHADGVITRSGGKVVKNVSGYDLMRPHIGAFGTLGVIAEVAFRLVPQPAAKCTYVATFDSLTSARSACTALLRAPFQPERFVLWSGPRAAEAIEDLRGSPNSGSAAACSLILTLAAGRAAVERIVTETKNAVAEAGATWHDSVGEPDGSRLWSAIEPGPADSPVLTARATFKPSAGFDYLEAISRTRPPPGVTPEGDLDLDAVFHVGFGTILTHWTVRPRTSAPSSQPAAQLAANGTRVVGLEGVSKAVEQVRRIAAAHGAVAVTERCPGELKRHIDVWGESGPAIEIMRNMKRQFDPAGTLNPGRFVGGI